MQIVGRDKPFQSLRQLWQLRQPLATLGVVGVYSLIMLVAGAILYRSGIHWQVYSELKTNALPYVQAGWQAPKNTLASMTVTPTSLKIDMNWEAKQRLAFQRKQAMDVGIILPENKQTVSASIGDGNEKSKVKMRLKGDWVDHLADDDKWSFRVKVSGSDTFRGMKQFSLHHPKTRNWAGEWLFHQALKREDLIALRYDFVNVTLNGKNLGIYALEEHFEKRLIENNQRREGPIVRFSEDILWQERVNQWKPFPDALGNVAGDYLSSDINTFQLSKALEDEGASRQHHQAIMMLDLLRRDKLTASEVFDVEKMATYFALSDLFGAGHGLVWHNFRFYYNPVTARLEPVGFDANAAIPIKALAIQFWTQLPDNPLHGRRHEFFNSLFQDPQFQKQYIAQLNRIAHKDYLDNLLTDLGDELSHAIRILHTEYAYYEFDPQVLYRNQQYIRSVLHPVQGVLAFFSKPDHGEIKVQVGNIHCLPVDIKGLQVVGVSEMAMKPQAPTTLAGRRLDQPYDYHNMTFTYDQLPEADPGYPLEYRLLYEVRGTNNTREVPLAAVTHDHQYFLANDFLRKPANVKQFDWLLVDSQAKTIRIKPGKHQLKKDMILPQGYRLFASEATEIDMINSAAIVSFSPVTLIGREDSPIVLRSSDQTGQGIAVIQANKPSQLEHVQFINLTCPSKPTWQLTGAVTFYESPVTLANCQIVNNLSEDGLNIIRSEFDISRSLFVNTMSDSFDADFCKGTMRDTRFVRCGNDGIDVSGSIVALEGITVDGANDKAISAGEASRVKASNLNIQRANIALASKDRSLLEVDGVSIADSEHVVAVFQKKPEFGPAVICVDNLTATDIRQESLIEKDSLAVIDASELDHNQENVRDILYAFEASTAQAK